MAPYGDLKVNNLIYETGSGDVTVAASTIPSTAGATFTGDVTLTGGSYNVVWDKSDNALEFGDNAKATFGSTLSVDTNGTNSSIKGLSGHLNIHIADNKSFSVGDSDFSENILLATQGAGCMFYHAANLKLATSSIGIDVTGTAVTDGLTVAGDSSFTGQSDFTGHLKEAVTVTAGKLSDNLNLDIANGNVFLFTTAESATSTPNLRYNGSTTLASKMAIGDCLSVTIITTANASAYSAQLKIDGGDVVENWTGGSAPSAGGSSGLDIHAYTIIKTAATGTSQNDYKVIANHTKTS